MSSPTGDCSDSGSRRPISVRSSISSTVVSSALASSSRLGSRPIVCANWNRVRFSLRSRSWMCTGRRIERERSAIARVMPWRIHQVAYVENLKPRRQSNSSTARISPMLPSWIRSSSGSPWPWYLRATETTSRRLAMMNRCRAASAFRTSWRAFMIDLLGPQAAGAEALLPLLAVLDQDGELDLLLLGEEWLARRRLQVQAEVVGVVGPERDVPVLALILTLLLEALWASRNATQLGPRELGFLGQRRRGAGRSEKTPWQPLFRMVRGASRVCKAQGR